MGRTGKELKGEETGHAGGREETGCWREGRKGE